MSTANHRTNTTPVIPEPLFEDISKGRASLFLGAGASQEAKFPGGQELAAYLGREAGTAIASSLDGRPLDEVAQYLYLQSGFGPQWIRQKIIDLFETRLRAIQRPVSFAHEGLTRYKWSSIFTTNFDRLVEVTYDSSPSSVQRLLPVYGPDRQNVRHEENLLRLFKLNGSVDEAARNASHQLVLTFAEQQDARRRNAQFYDLLRDAAANGPVIFIGFGFSHPGANTALSSPSFMELRQLLADMGAAARWHYSVAPFDPVTVHSQLSVAQLRDVQVAALNINFSDFIAAIDARLTSRPPALEGRRPITVPVGERHIEIPANEYDKDQRHFEVLGMHIEDEPVPPVGDSLNGKETWGSFVAKHRIERQAKREFREVVASASRNPAELVLFSASPGWGKTFLLKDLAVDAYAARRPVVWLNPNATLDLTTRQDNVVTVSNWDAVRLDRIVEMLNLAARGQPNEHGLSPLIIADNCPERAIEVARLYRELVGNSRSFLLVLSTRETDYEALRKISPIYRKCKRYTPESHADSEIVAMKEVRALIDFCVQQHVATFADASQREVVAQRILREEADRALLIALQVIFDKQHRPFSEIVRSLWEGITGDVERKLVLRVSSLNRFGGGFSPRFYCLLQTFPSPEHRTVGEAYRQCLESGVLVERAIEGEYSVSTQHPLIAEHIILNSGVAPSSVDEEMIALVEKMGGTVRDVELVRRLAKRITDYDVNLSSEEMTLRFFQTAATSTNNDWVVCQQFSKYLLQRDEFKESLAWIERAISDNPDHASLHHTRGNVLRRWGVNNLDASLDDQADAHFEAARRCFTVSRMKPEPDEYGYVTHLDMLLTLINREYDEAKRTNLRAEGVLLFKDGIRTVPQDRYNFLLEERFAEAFDEQGKACEDLVNRIGAALRAGKSSTFAGCYLADRLTASGRGDEALRVLASQKRIDDTGVLVWLKEAEVLARSGSFSEAARAMDSAKRREKKVENDEVQWRLLYWDLLIAFARGDFNLARHAQGRLDERSFFAAHTLPRGYLWRETARGLPANQRSFREHAQVFRGRIEEVKAGGKYGMLSVRSPDGSVFRMPFAPRYFQRSDLPRGASIDFIATFQAHRIRADDVNGTPFIDTTDDLYCR